jgi:hypothetical protein
VTAILVVFGILLVLFLWFVLGGRGGTHEPTLHRRHDDTVNRAELEQAERDVQAAPDEQSVRDWGPGAAKPRPPELL